MFTRALLPIAAMFLAVSFGQLPKKSGPLPVKTPVQVIEEPVEKKPEPVADGAAEAEIPDDPAIAEIEEQGPIA